MNILTISSILPIPGAIKGNDFVFQTYEHYKEFYKEDSVRIIKPIKIDFNLFTILRKNTRLDRLNGNLSRSIRGFQVEIFTYLSWWSFRNLHALLTCSIYFLNRKKNKLLFSGSGIDIIHAHYIYPDGILALFLSKKYKVPYVITTHNEKFYFDHIISRNVAKIIFKNAAKVFPINYFNFQYFKSIGIKNIELKPLGFNKSFIRKQKRISDDVINILTVCELIKLKNIDKVILAFSGLVKKYNIHYTIIGNGPEKESLITLTSSLGINESVSFVEHVAHNEIAYEMAKHDIFIMPSYFETFGRVYFEVMAMGIPIICAKNSGISGFFKEKEEGISVIHDDITNISEALEYLIINSEQRMSIGRNGKRLVEKYSWENIVQDLHNEYRNIVDTSKQPSI